MINKLLVILGPTATGKTDISLYLAKKLNGELISCDSRQIYVGLDIGTGKLPSGRWKMEHRNWKRGKGYWEINRIKVWMYDVVDPKIQYTVADYVKDADRVVTQITRRGELPIITGGTGLYSKALLEGLSNPGVPVDKKLREELEKLPLSSLQKKLKVLSPARWDNMNTSDSQNPRRLVRAIELTKMYPYIMLQNKPKGLLQNYNILKIGLTAPRRVLYKKADLRLLSRLDQGMVKEAEYLYKRDLSLKRMKQLGLEYGVLADYLGGKIKDIKTLTTIMQGKIHSFIRRQLTWFKKEEDVKWFDISKKGVVSEIEKFVRKWYNNDV